MKRVITTICFCALFYTGFAQIDQSLSYEEFQTRAVDLLRKSNIDSAIIIMEYAVTNFPEEEQWSTNFLAQLNIRSGNNAKAVEIWKAGMEKGYNYHLTNPLYDRYFKDDSDFQKLVNIEKEKIDRSHIKHEVFLPSSYSESNNYPLIFIFHGNNRNIESAKTSWTSQTMTDKYITVFLQSYIYSNDINYAWTSGDAKTEMEFKDIYGKILTGYSVDTTKIILAGMSAGGRLSLEFAFNEFVPVSGLVLNCPVVPENIGDELIDQFVAKKHKIAIITGDKDFALEGQKGLVSKINEKGGQARITVSKDAGHEFVEGFSDLLSDYLKWIIE